tara:strand:- start:372 stop:917 length:546 start_codon:yes stop_codon:yes gene_type:complete
LKLDEVTKWTPFVYGEDIYDLSHLDAHKVTYTHSSPGKPDVVYDFWVTYSFHCFAKDYSVPGSTAQEHLMYSAPKDKRPFCFKRYGYSKAYLRNIISNLGSTEIKVTHAGYSSYAAHKVICDDGSELWYFVPFKVYKEKKKFRIHVTSAYPLDKEPGGGRVKFFTIAHCLKTGKKLPKPHK